MEYQKCEADGKEKGQDWAKDGHTASIVINSENYNNVTACLADTSEDYDNITACLADMKTSHHIPTVDHTNTLWPQTQNDRWYQ